MKVVINCSRDPLIEQYCRKKYQKKWQESVDNLGHTAQVCRTLLYTFDIELKREAVRQDWWDYELPEVKIVPEEVVAQ